MTTVQDIYAVVKQYFNKSGIPITNLTSITVDGTTALMGRHNAVLKLMKVAIHV